MKIEATVEQAGACHQAVMVAVGNPEIVRNRYPHISSSMFEQIGQKLQGALERAGLRLEGEDWRINGVNRAKLLQIDMRRAEVEATSQFLAVLLQGPPKTETEELWEGFNTVLTSKLKSAS